jgi:hypothetical protein
MISVFSRRGLRGHGEKIISGSRELRVNDLGFFSRRGLRGYGEDFLVVPVSFVSMLSVFSRRGHSEEKSFSQALTI